MWSAVEINVGIICACVPSLKPLAARLLPRMIRGSTESSSTQFGSAVRSKFPRAEAAPLAIPEIQNPPASFMAPGAYTDQGPAAAAEAAPPPPPHRLSQELIEMSDFLVNSGPGLSDDTESSATTDPSPPLNMTTFFDFVNLKKPKSMLAMSNKESIPPLALTTILFFLWGIGYGFLDTLNTQFGWITGVSTWGSLGFARGLLWRLPCQSSYHRTVYAENMGFQVDFYRGTVHICLRCAYLLAIRRLEIVSPIRYIKFHRGLWIWSSRNGSKPVHIVVRAAGERRDSS